MTATAEMVTGTAIPMPSPTTVPMPEPLPWILSWMGGCPVWMPETPLPAAPATMPALNLSGPSAATSAYSTQELSSADAALFVNHFDLGMLDPRVSAKLILARLTPGAQRMLEQAGLATSFGELELELISYEVLARSEGAELLKLGNEIGYDSEAGEKASYLVQIDGIKIGVTATLARSVPSDAEYTLAKAADLLESSLQGIAQANENVSAEDQWSKQILHILAYSEAHATVLQTAYAALDAETKGNTIVIITITDGNDTFLY